MPSWSIHLAIAKNINKKLNVDKDLFYIGNLIADVNYGCILNRRDTHYDENNKCIKCPTENLPNIKDFLEDYKTKLDNPIILGYYVHLLTDYYYNNYVFSNSWILDDNKEVIGIKLKNKNMYIKDEDKKIRKKLKHYDFDLYGKYLFKNNEVEIPSIIKEDKYFKDLKKNFFTINDANKRIEYLNTKFIKFNNINLKERIFGYKLYSEEELDNLYKECCKHILNNLQKDCRM